jgi:hypothetical protein
MSRHNLKEFLPEKSKLARGIISIFSRIIISALDEGE